MILARLSQYITKWSIYSYAVKHRRRLSLLALLAFALGLALALYLVFLARQPVILTTADQVGMAWTESQQTLRTLEAVTQLRVIQSQLALPNPPRELEVMTGGVARTLEAIYENTPAWAELEPLLDSLNVQVANADPLSENTIDEIIGLLRTEPPG